MRQVFTSPRLENVETVAQMLRDADIEVRITNGRSYKGGRRGTFSYSDSSSTGPQAAVWVVRSEDQVRAREILRDAGLLDSTRESFAPASFRFESQAAAGEDKKKSRLLRIKLVLIAGIAVVGALAIMHALKQDPAADALKTHPFDGSVTAVPQALAAAVFNHELAKAPKVDVLCLAVDGRDPSNGLLQGMQEALTGRNVVAASECVRNANEDVGSTLRATGKPAQMIDVTAFRPKSAESGVIEYTAYRHRMSASYKTLEVKLVDGRWQVVRTVKHVSM